MSESSKQQRHPADLGDPDPGPQLRPFRHRQVHQGRFPRLVGEQPQWQTLRVMRRVCLVLPAVGGQRLPEIARPVQQADGNQRQAQIGRGFEVVTGQDAETTGVVRQHLGHAELHREVRDAGRQRPGRLFLIPPRPGQVGVQIGVQVVEALQKRLVGRQLVEPFGAHCPQQRHRVLLVLRPQCLVDVREEFLGRGVPGRSQIDRQPLQRCEAIGQMGADGEPAEGLHASIAY